MNSILTAAKSYRASNSHFLQLWWCKYSSTAASSEVNIKIPNRIHRGPTDILKALEKNISYDLTGPNYKFSDDPHLAPYHERQARLYSLAKSAGQKAARWVRDEHPELFTQVVSDPPVMSYMPPVPITGDTVTEEILFHKISTAKVSEAIKVYEIMQEKKMDVSQETQLALLELLCFYNSTDPTPMEHAAERYYGHGSNKRKDLSLNNWQNHPLVNTLFSSLKGLGSAPYSALICGMYSNGAKVDGDKLVAEAKENNVKLDVHAYNAIIIRTISVYDKTEVKKQMAMDILKEMDSKGVKPNLGSLNSVLDCVSRLGFVDKYSFMVQLITEFNRIGIEPSPGTFALVIRGLVGRTRADSNLQVFLSSILKCMKGKQLSMRHASDEIFFDWVMKACVVIDSLPLAIEGLELFLHSKNRMLSDGYKTNAFFNNFFLILSKLADFETLTKYYKLLVPHAHSASPIFYEVLFEACDVNGAVKEMPGFWRDYMATGALSEDALTKMLQASVNLTSLPDPAAFEARPIIGELADNFLLHKISAAERVFDRTPLTPELCNHILILLGRGCRWRTVQTCLQFMTDKNMTPEEKVILQIIDNCYDHGNPNMAVWVLKYCHSSFKSEIKLQKITSRVMKSGFLSNDQIKELKDVIDESSSSSSSSCSSSSDSDSSDSDADSSDSEDISIPKKPKPEIVKPDITKMSLNKNF